MRVAASEMGQWGRDEGGFFRAEPTRGIMRDLLWTLARIDCLVATQYLVRGDQEGARRHVARAAGLLECRARSRDSTEPWQTVLAAVGAKGG